MKKNRKDTPAGNRSQEAESSSRSEMKAAKAAEKTRRIEEMKAAKAASAEAERSDSEAKKAAKAAEKTRRIEEMKAAKAAKKDAKRNVAQDGGVKPAAANDSTQPSDKTIKRSERAAKNDAKKAAKAAAKARRIEEMRAAKAAKKDVKKAAKAAAVEAKRSDVDAKKAAKAAAKAASKTAEKTPRNKAAEDVRPEKDPLRPRFAVAPGSVRVFTVLAVFSAVLSAAWSTVAALAANSQVTISVIEDVPQGWVLGSAIAAAVAALLWVFAAVKVSTGFRSGLIVGWLSVILSMVTVVAPFALILGLTLQSRDSRDWAI